MDRNLINFLDVFLQNDSVPSSNISHASSKKQLNILTNCSSTDKLLDSNILTLNESLYGPPDYDELFNENELDCFEENNSISDFSRRHVDSTTSKLDNNVEFLDTSQCEQILEELANERKNTELFHAGNRNYSCVDFQANEEQDLLSQQGGWSQEVSNVSNQEVYFHHVTTRKDLIGLDQSSDEKNASDDDLEFTRFIDRFLANFEAGFNRIAPHHQETLKSPGYTSITTDSKDSKVLSNDDNEEVLKVKSFDKSHQNSLDTSKKRGKRLLKSHEMAYERNNNKRVKSSQEWETIEKINKSENKAIGQNTTRKIKNNAASRIHRAKKKQKHEDLFKQQQRLEKSNTELQIRAEVMQREIDLLKKLLLFKGK